jgi:hypothetical protein
MVVGRAPVRDLLLAASASLAHPGELHRRGTPFGKWDADGALPTVSRCAGVPGPGSANVVHELIV